MRHVPVVAALFILILIGIVPTPATADFAEDTRLCSSSSNPDESIAACTRQISSGRWKGRDLAAAHNNRAVAYNNKGEYDRAIADATEAIRLDPKHATAYYNRGLAYSIGGDYDRAI